MKTYIRILAAAFLLLASFSETRAKAPEKNDVRFAYDVDFNMNFDNREYYRSNYSTSMTIFGARLTPSVGIHVKQSKSINHKIMLGIDIMKDFGASPVSPEIAGTDSPETSSSLSNTKLLREMTLYYRLHKQGGKNEMMLYAGIFPRSAMEGSYSEAFFSDSLKFYDNNLEGILMKLRRPKAYFELGCDWMGQYGESRREKFMIFSSGEGKVAPILSLGYSVYMYHFASCNDVRGVVDNILANPYARFDFGHLLGLQTFSMRFGWLQGMQNDRKNVGTYVYPCGGEFDIEVRKWNLALKNSLFYGTDMMTYYNNVDSGGYKYGCRLYFGDPFYRVHDEGETGPGIYDRIELCYEPKIGRFLNIRIAARFHFNDFTYSGCQQVVALRFNLQELVNRRK